MIQGCAKFDNNVKAEDEKAGKGLGCEPSGVLVFGSAVFIYVLIARLLSGDGSLS